MSDDLFHEHAHQSDLESQNQSPDCSLVPVDRQGASPSLHTDQVDQQRLDGLAQEILELKLVYLSDTDKANREVAQLRGHIYWLTVVLVGAIALASGVISWLSFNLRSDQYQLMQQVEAIATEAVTTDRINQLESQVSELNERFPERLIADVEANQSQLQDLEIRIADIAGQVNTRRQTIAILARALQDLINEEDQEAIAPALSPDPSSDADAEEINGDSITENASPSDNDNGNDAE
jgi:hypothetical protein